MKLIHVLDDIKIISTKLLSSIFSGIKCQGVRLIRMCWIVFLTDSDVGGDLYHNSLYPWKEGGGGGLCRSKCTGGC